MFLSKRGNFGQHMKFLRFCSTSPGFLRYGKDPAPFFIDPQVQKLLKSVTGINYDKIFSKLSKKENLVDLQFMTAEKLQKQVKVAHHRAQKLLQMPPIVKVHEENLRIISQEPEMDGFSDSKYVAIDISFDVKDTKRVVLVRHQNGNLETAPLDVRKRVTQIYVPHENRKITKPKMFEPEFFERVLEEQKYEFILDRACTQFEPYEQEYHDITSQTYQHINKNKRFNDLRSTRHFGTMTFFLAWHKMIDDLLLDCLKRGFLRNAVEIILLHHKLHAISDEEAVQKCLTENPDTRDVAKEYYEAMISGTNHGMHQKIDYDAEKIKQENARDEAFLQQIEQYAKSHGVKKIFLETAIQTCREEMEKKMGDARQVASS
ncbi:small ribosomal subunit protein mS22 [Culicoides brevitarsis]|uniref:small ribosomal subunit protein mS22 n=1 Tax=Culicoides brevitarsis TaxID=469753 RepID=UPI00307C3DA9